jgi:starch phosphorylase
MKSVLPRFNTIRMALDYVRDSYAPAAREGRRLAADGAAGARELAQWKQKIAAAWPSVRARLATPTPPTIHAGESLPLDVAVHLNGLQPDDIFVECVLANPNAWGKNHSTCGVPLFLVGEATEGETLFHCDLFDTGMSCQVGGLQQFHIRVYPCHHLLSHPLECGYMIWL